MSRPALVVVAAWVALAGASAGPLRARDGQPQDASTTPAATLPQSSATASNPAPRALLNRYCVGCHNERMKASYAGLALDSVDPTEGRRSP